MKYLSVLLFLFAATVSPLRAETFFFDEEFENKLADGWFWIREVPEQHRFKNDALEIQMEPNPAVGIQNILVRKAPGKDVGAFVIELEVDSEKPFSNQYQQVGIYWLKGEQVKFKFVKEFIDGKLYVFPGKKPLGTQRVTLRLVVEDRKVTGLFKPRGAGEFQKACEATLPERNDEDDRIAIQCWHGPAGGECWTRLERFQIRLPKSGGDNNLKAKAAKRIEQYRKSDVTISIAEADGTPIIGVKLELKMLRHRFLFGYNIFKWARCSNEAANDEYRREYAELFNFATLGFYWWDFESEKDHPKYANAEQVAAWCHENGIQTKGHPLAWNYIDPAWAKNINDEELYRRQMD